MNPSELNILHVVHVAGVLALIAYTFFAFAAPPETRRRVLAITGIAALLVLLTGIRLWQGQFGFSTAPGMRWVLVKLVCWLGLSALSGMAYRRRNQANTLMVVALLLAVVALIMVYCKPF